MSQSRNFLSKYYGRNGAYLKEHELFLRSANIKKDVLFLIKILDLKKRDIILDIACGQGRHTNALAKIGYLVDGVDFSNYLLIKAKENISKPAKIHPNYYLGNVEKLKLENRYNKAYWFFADLANINIPKAIFSIYNNMAKGGRVLFDTDNIFRIVAHLRSHPNSPFGFDAHRLDLIDKKANLRIPYAVLPQWEDWFASAGFKIDSIFGDYDFSRYTVNSLRLIMVVKKTA